jgi:hypothetical protein
MVKGPAEDATDAPQPWGLLCNPVMKMISSFSFFQVMEHRWNDIDRGKPKYSGKNLSQCHFVHHKSHMDWPEIERLGMVTYVCLCICWSHLDKNAEPLVATPNS